MRSKKNLRPSVAPLLLALLLVASLLPACASTEAPKPQLEEELATDYTLRLGETETYEKPLPSRTPVLVDWYLANGGKRTVEGFRGWDFNEDGRFEMVEVLDEKGGVQTRVYDFDGDGRVDLMQP